MSNSRYEASKPFQKIAADLKGPIPTRDFTTDFKAESFYILVIIDVFTRFVSTYFRKSF